MPSLKDLVDGGEPALRELIGSDESIVLECKEAQDAERGVVLDGDKKNLGKELSALSNSMGGLLIWGLEARRDNTTGVDQIKDVRPINNVQAFKARLLQLTQEALMPRVSDFELAVIPCAHRPDAGYVLVSVARSERRPHRCEFSKQYYRRAGSGSYIMEHFEIEDAFRRRAAPHLEFVAQLRDGGNETWQAGGRKTIHVDMFLRNNSPFSARFPYLIVPAATIFRFEDGPPAGVIKYLSRGNFVFEGGATVVVNPGVDRHMATTRIDYNLTRTQGGFVLAQKKVTPLAATMKYGCFDAALREETLTLSASDLARMLAQDSMQIIFEA